MDPRLRNIKGQTALEYLLLIVVALVLIVGIMMWMQAAGDVNRGTATNRTNDILCDIKECSSDADCAGVPPCGPSATCGPDDTCEPR